MVQTAPGISLPHNAPHSSMAGRSPTASGLLTPTGQDSKDSGDSSLRWRCKELGCGAAFLTREQLRTHMKLGQHGVGAPPVAEMEMEAASRERRSLRVPPRSGGYALRVRGEGDGLSGDELDEMVPQPSPAAARPDIGSPEDLAKLPGGGVHPRGNPNTWDNSTSREDPKASREAAKQRAMEMEKVSVSLRIQNRTGNFPVITDIRFGLLSSHMSLRSLWCQAQRRREAEWAAQLKVAQEEVARQQKEDEQAQSKRKAQEQAEKFEEDEKVQLEVVEKTMERLNKWKKQRVET